MTIRVALLAAECEPWAKTGGLADVVDALARALGRLPEAGTELATPIDVFLPRYRTVAVPPQAEREPTITVADPRGGAPLEAGIIDVAANGYRLRLVDVPAASQMHRQVIRKTVDLTGLIIDPVVHPYYVEVMPNDLGGDRSDLVNRIGRLYEVLEQLSLDETDRRLIELGRGERLWDSPDDLLDRFHRETVPSPSGVTHQLFWRR